MQKTKSLPKLKKKALDLYSELVKLRAANEGKLYCYTCDAPLKLNTSNTQLGHFLSRGAYPGLTFHPDNSRVQDYRCNVMLHGATIEFRTRLICEIGSPAVEKLEAQRFDSVKWSRFDFEQMIENYSEEIKLLK
ncbi:MAG TPA: recombination protein NinG [Patescibacteria group bacterium]|nr:recombination protein NinG [Patescibacteria group bacterium]